MTDCRSALALLTLLIVACGRIGFEPLAPSGLDGGGPPADGPVGDTDRDAPVEACTVTSETCNGEDDDCNGLVDDNAQTLLCPAIDEVCWAGRCGPPPQAQWAVRWGGSNYDQATAVAFCPDGELVVGGSFRGTASLGALEFVSQGGGDAVILRLRADGTPRWLWNRGASRTDTVSAVACEADGRVLAAGSFEGPVSVEGPETIDLGGGARVLATGSNAFGVMLDSAGAWRWDRVMGAMATGPAGNATASSLAVTEDGDVLVAGSFDGSVDLGSGQRTTAGGLDAFLVRLDAEGNLRNEKTWGSTLDDEAVALAGGPDGSVILAGSSNGPIRLGADAHVNSDENSDAFVARLDHEGALLAERWWTGTGFHFTRGVAVLDNAIAACGQVSGNTRIDGADGELPVPSVADALLVFYDPLLVDAAGKQNEWGRDAGR